MCSRQRGRIASTIAPLAVLAVALASGACGTDSVPVLFANDADGGADGAGLGDVLVPFPYDGGTRAEYCAGSGPPFVVVPGDGGATAECAGRIAETHFRYALCTCEGYVSNHALTTDAFDSSQGAYDAGPLHVGASVGTNGSFNATGAVTVGGSLWGSDPTGITLSGRTDAQGELHCEGRLNSGQPLRVGADAFLGGDLVTQSDVTVVGTLHQSPGKTSSVGGTKSIGATDTSANVTVPPPCDCAPADLVDIAGIVEEYRAHNDDAAIPLDPRLFENVTAPLDVTIPCGRFFFTRISANASVHLKIEGRTAIFVGGDVAVNAGLVVEVMPGSELDLFIAGNVVSGAAFSIGSAANPAKARTYVGGGGTVNLQKAATLAGNLYAPRAEIVLGGAATVFGSLFARRLSTQGDLTIHYDEAVLHAGSGCPPTATTCRSCRDCANQACTGGACGACTSSADCCSPLVCRSGRCIADIR